MTSNNLTLTPEDFLCIQEMCDKQIPLYKIAATFDSCNGNLLTELSKTEREEALQALLNRLTRSILPPNDVFILDDPVIVSAHWYPPFPLYFNDPSDLVNLMSNFQTYLESFTFTKGVIDPDTWFDQENSLADEEALYQKLLGISIKAEKLDDYQTKQLLQQGGIKKIWRSILVHDFRSIDHSEKLYPNHYY